MNFINWTFECWLRSRGFDAKRAKFFRKSFMQEWKKSNHSFREKLWAARHGFFANKLDWYRLTPKNFMLYISDYEYLRLHPYNNHFAFWINDKITLKYMLQKPLLIEGKLIEIMPEYYLYIENDGHYTYLMDSPMEINHDEEYLLNLLKTKKILAVKPSNRSFGEGFYKVELKNSDIYVNGEHLQQDFMAFVQTLKGYIVTEYCRQHHLFDEIWNGSECTLRVFVIQKSTNNYTGVKPHIIGSLVRFGTSKSKGACNLSSGGVGVTIDFETGICDSQFYSEYRYKDTGLFTKSQHPDSGYKIGGMLMPNWDIVKCAVWGVCKHLSSLELLGLDIIITETGIKLCEINSLSSVDAQLLHGPFFCIPEFKDYIERKKSERCKRSFLTVLRT